jgi:hypothetical protein
MLLSILCTLKLLVLLNIFSFHALNSSFSDFSPKKWGALFFAPKTLDYLAFQSFDFEGI